MDGSGRGVAAAATLPASEGVRVGLLAGLVELGGLGGQRRRDVSRSRCAASTPIVACTMPPKIITTAPMMYPMKIWLRLNSQPVMISRMPERMYVPAIIGLRPTVSKNRPSSSGPRKLPTANGITF
jgi:hypothetical protein